jgi:hypothetical protein
MLKDEPLYSLPSQLSAGSTKGTHSSTTQHQGVKRLTGLFRSWPGAAS